MSIAEELIEQVRDAADLVEIIGEKVQLKRTGSDYRGGCPFHGGTGRNFAVIPKKGMFYCYVCHEAGDVFTWYMKQVGMDYPTAVREVARRVGIVVPERAEREGPDPNEPLYAATALAQEWFARQLRDAKEAQPARDYLAKRGVSLEQASEHGLGYAPRDLAVLTELGRLGVRDEVLRDAGLATRRDDGTLSPRFRARLLFPIHDVRGRVVAFGGRLLGPGEPKYLNSPDTPIFHKGKLLYNLHAARGAIRKEEVALLVEGYFDVLRLVLAGVENVVAGLGTALTPDQARLVRRYAAQATLLYDSDSAGLRATFRAGDELLRHGVRVRVATMPEGEDPDTLVQRGGAQALAPVLRDAVDVLERKIQLLDRKGWFSDVQRRREALDRLLPTIRAASDPIARELYLGLVGEKVGLRREVLEAEVARYVERPAETLPAQGPRAGGVAPPHDAAPVREPARPRERTGRIEAQLLGVLLVDPTWIQRARDEVPPELFRVPTLRRIFEALLAADADASLVEVAAGFDPATARAWERVVERAEEARGMDLDATFADTLKSLLEEVRMQAAQNAPTTEEKKKLLKEISPEGVARMMFRTAAKNSRRPI